MSEVFAGRIVWDLAHARTTMQRYREFLPNAPEELGIFLGLHIVPSCDPFPRERWGRLMCLLMCCHDGPEEQGRAALAPLLDALPEPWFDWMGMMPCPAVQSMFEGLYPTGMQWYWRGDFVRALPDVAIDAHPEPAARAPTGPCGMHLHPIDGAVHRVAPGDSAWHCRDATWSMVIVGPDPDPAKAGAITAWTKARWEAVHPHTLGGAYPDVMMADEAEARVRAAFGSNHARPATV